MYLIKTVTRAVDRPPAGDSVICLREMGGASEAE